MNLASLPARPLSLEECRDLENSGRFRTLVPAGVFDLSESDRRLVPAVVFVTESSVVAAGYVLAVDADADADAATGDAATADDPGGWTVVTERAAPEEKEALEEEVRAVGADLRAWAENQSWADDPSALLDAL
jgi:hypothetical protein